MLSEKAGLNSLQQEFMYWRSVKRGGEAVPEDLRRKAVEKLLEYEPSEIEKSLKISTNMLLDWRKKYSLPEAVLEKSENNFPTKPIRKKEEAVFIALPVEKSELPSSEVSRDKLLLKFSNGSLSMEGDLSLSEWEQALRLLGK